MSEGTGEGRLRLTKKQREDLDTLKQVVDLSEGALSDISRAGADVNLAKKRLNATRDAISKLDKIKEITEKQEG